MKRSSESNCKPALSANAATGHSLLNAALLPAEGQPETVLQQQYRLACRLAEQAALRGQHEAAEQHTMAAQRLQQQLMESALALQRSDSAASEAWPNDRPRREAHRQRKIQQG